MILDRVEGCAAILHPREIHGYSQGLSLSSNCHLAIIQPMT
jgi:hypothetical protein